MNIKDFTKLTSDMDVEFMPIAPIDEIIVDADEKASFPEILPIVALKNTVLFPSVVLPINASRTKSVEAFQAAAKQNQLVGVVTQKEASVDEPNINDLYNIGTIARIVKQINMPDGNRAVFIMGRTRFRIDELVGDSPYLQAKVTYLDDEPVEQDDKQYIALVASIKELVENIISLSGNFPPEVSLMIKNIENDKFLLNYICTNIGTSIQEKQNLLEEANSKRRAERLVEILQNELQIAQIKNEITVKTKGAMDRQQREYFLQQQLKSIRDELEGESGSLEIKELMQKAEGKNWPAHAKEAFEKGIARLEKIHPHAPEFPVHYNYLTLLTELPWNEVTEDDFSLKRAEEILDADHYGLEKVKDRILEYLAVLQHKGDLRSPILCFVGPPGIGKTSLGQSIAKAIGRKYVRMSLGGLHDESELRGHRKTYIGAMPGRIIQSLRKVKSSNPVFILDEIEKMGKDFRGDPSTALLEILDPEQNSTFYDNYLELDYDLSKVMFIATANSVAEIQPALRDRMEIIQLSGYSVEEKLEIARKHLIPKQKAAHGLDKFKFTITKDALEYLINHYTRESGLRELDRNIAAIMRNVARRLITDPNSVKKVDKPMIREILGLERYTYEQYQRNNPPGVAVGLAWTYLGGDILFIESVLSPGKGNLTLTGNLGDVMKESAMTALTYIKSNAEKYGINPELFEKKNIHIHVPEGAIPKDGPSAGITMLTALGSVLTQKPVRPYMAMTGEITLRGQVLPVGGIKEKILAAKRAGLKIIVLSEANRKDVEEIKPDYIKGLEFHYVKTMEEVLEYSLVDHPTGQKKTVARKTKAKSK